MSVPKFLTVTLPISAVLAAAVALGGCSSDDDETSAPPQTTTTTGGSTTTSGPPDVTTATATPATTPDGQLVAPWAGNGMVPEKEVDADLVDTWKSAKNAKTCRLIVAADLGPELAGAKLNIEDVNDQQGWQYHWRKGGAVLQVIGLFPVPETPKPALFSKRYSDGSVVRYGPDAGDEPLENVDPDTTANEAALQIPGQGCEYRIYDTLGKAHIERVIDQVRLVG